MKMGPKIRVGVSILKMMTNRHRHTSKLTESNIYINRTKPIFHTKSETEG